MSEEPRILRPRPRKPFNLTPESSEAPTPAEPANPDLLTPKDASGMHDVSRNGSIMNLTSSTLYGIYSPTAFDSARDESSPWGTEAHTPNADHPIPAFKMDGPDRFSLERSRSRLSHGLVRGVILPRVLRGVLLFGFGIVYGVITVHLHENHWITPVKLENIHYYESWQYLGFWGLTGVTLGNILPWLDVCSEGTVLDTTKKTRCRDNEDRTPTWVAAVRSVGAFVGIAFAMRRLPWESTTQASVTLALANPVLWYLIDRTRSGFFLSTIVGLAGMGIILGLKPELMRSSINSSTATSFGPDSTGADFAFVTSITQEGVAVRTWVASVLFCACVCFGNIGRQLAIGET